MEKCQAKANSSLNDEVKAVNVDGTEATVDNINSGEYKVARPFNIATREDTKVLERAKSINIEFDEDEDTIVGEVRSYSESSGLLKLYDDSRKLYIDDSTICVVNGKIVSASNLEKGNNI